MLIQSVDYFIRINLIEIQGGVDSCDLIYIFCCKGRMAHLYEFERVAAEKSARPSQTIPVSIQSKKIKAANPMIA